MLIHEVKYLEHIQTNKSFTGTLQTENNTTLFIPSEMCLTSPFFSKNFSSTIGCQDEIDQIQNLFIKLYEQGAWQPLQRFRFFRNKSHPNI
jgi:hypothetical protein